MPRSRALSPVLLALALSACSENFGTAPIDVSGRIHVAAEEAAGPPPLSQAALSLAGTDGRLWLGLERGLYHVLPGAWDWLPGHPGYSAELGASTPRRILFVDVDATGRVSVHLSRGGGTDILFASVDGGSTFRELGIPNVIIGEVDAVAALPPSTFHPEGAFLAAQSAAVYVRSLGDEWERVTLPAAPRHVRSAAASAGGHVVLGVELADGSPAVWSSEDGGWTFSEAGVGGILASDVLQVAVSKDGHAAAATRTALLGPGGEVEIDRGAFTRVGLRFVGDRLRFAGLTDDARVYAGTLEPGTDPTVIDGPPGVAAILVTARQTYVATNPGADLWQLEGSTWTLRGFRGRTVWMTALAADPRSPGSIYLGHFRGNVFFGPSTGDMIDLGSSSLSTCSALLADRRGLGVFSGNYGVQLIEANVAGAPWLDRSTGQSGVQDPTGPVVVQGLQSHPDDGEHLWLGSQLGDGPYESVNGGLFWTVVAGGLGPRDLFIGYPAVTQVRAFAFVDGETWMATFRGGVWSLSEARIWEQSNAGLPDITGAVVDTCCFDPPDPDDIFAPTPTEVDVRDLVALEDGALLAATGWGVFRDEGRGGQWQLSSDGLTNSDVFVFEVHPLRPQWVLAGARGNADNPDWLFLSRDGGRHWNPVDSGLRGRFAANVVWSDPSALEVVALLIGSGAWRMEIAP